MNTQLREDFKRFLATGGYCTPPGRTMCALKSARTLAEWREAEYADCVRLKLIPEEENYFDVYGQPDSQKEKDMIVASIERRGLWVMLERIVAKGVE